MGNAGRTGGDRDNTFRSAGGRRDCRGGRRRVRRRMALGFAQEQLRVRHGAINIAEENLFAVQRAVSGQRRPENNHQFGVVGVINQFKVRFWRGGAQQGFRHIGARLSESGINNQQRFHYASPAVN